MSTSRKIPEMNWGLWVGIILFVLTLLLPTSKEFTQPIRNILAVALLMGAWWMTEAIPLGITSLLPLVLYPLLGIMTTKKVAPNYANHLIFLFMGGFFIAIALQEWQLHRRFAFRTLLLIGGKPRRLIMAFMLSTALLSMWISNTATTIMMLPIALAVLHQLENSSTSKSGNTAFGSALMLGIAYSASMGGIATLIGTPPNVVFSGIYSKFFPDLPEFTFVKWMSYGLPLSIFILFFIWIYLSYFIVRPHHLPELQSKTYFVEELKKLGKMNTPQKIVMSIFFTTAFLWVFRGDISFGAWTLPGWPRLLGLAGKIHDSTIAIGMSLLLFAIPINTENGKQTLLGWKNIFDIPWDILLLFGGGFALADGIQSTGLANYLGQRLVFLGELPLFGMLFFLTFSVAMLTEFTSNTAVATTILPILAGVAIDLQISPEIIMIPATIAASCAYMLPVATPPNAIVFGTRYIPIRRMVSVGIFLNISVSIIIALYFTLIFG
ncbi:MAG: SLC13/DASS family transporter [Calditrichaeota bacterium]|nr:MAG: SLC13/DASS family transporter [Calditrichota bacterium]